MKKYAIILATIMMVILPLVGNAAVYDTITVSNSSVTLGSHLLNYGYINKCILFLETASIRIRMDGIAPTASVGHLVSTSNSPFTLDSNDEVKNFRAIKAGATDATLTVTCY